MCRIGWASLVAFGLISTFVVAGCQKSPPSVKPPARSSARSKAGPSKAERPGQASAAAADDFVIGEPFRHANLAIFPVLSKTVRDRDRFTTLDEGLENGTVKVFEVGAVADETSDRPAEATGEPHVQAENEPAGQTAAEVAGDVNRLMVLNTSGKPLYLMPGEIIIGGKQDRTIAQERIIPPGEQPVAIDVFCVEHGRWAGRSRAEHDAITFPVADRVSPDERARIAEHSDRGHFVASSANVSKKTRLSVQEGRKQTDVWDAVASTSVVGGVPAASGTFTANYADAGVLEKLEPYIEQLQQPVAKQERIIGVVVTINGKADSADLFESTPLFRKLWPKLLKSYALDAAHAEPEKHEKVCTVAEAREFLDKAMRADVAATKTHEGLVLTTRSTEGVTSFSAAAADAAEKDVGGMGGGMGGLRGGVHASAFSR
jgi:hypothetical protein